MLAGLVGDYGSLKAEVIYGEGGKVKWSDIDGNLYNDAVWLNPPFDDGPSNP